MKPVALIAAQLSNSSRRGDVVLDPFAGSGSTLIACEQLGRRCFAVELDPAYCDVIRRRYQEYTVAAERQPGSDRGRPAIDWEAAFAYYASPADRERSYRGSRRPVRGQRPHGREARPRGATGSSGCARSGPRPPRRLTDELVQTRAETSAKLSKLIEAILHGYAQQLAPAACG